LSGFEARSEPRWAPAKSKLSQLTTP